MNIAHTSDIPLGRAVYLPKAIASVQLGMCSIEDVVRLVISSCLVPACLVLSSPAPAAAATTSASSRKLDSRTGSWKHTSIHSLPYL